MNLWKECIREALCDAGIAATDEQIETIVGCCEGLHENYGMYSGDENIPNPAESQAKQELDSLKREKEANERFVLSTNPCKTCTTTGIVRDGWGRNQTCYDCNGSGRR